MGVCEFICQITITDELELHAQQRGPALHWGKKWLVRIAAARRRLLESVVMWTCVASLDVVDDLQPGGGFSTVVWFSWMCLTNLS